LTASRRRLRQLHRHCLTLAEGACALLEHSDYFFSLQSTHGFAVAFGLPLNEPLSIHLAATKTPYHESHVVPNCFTQIAFRLCQVNLLAILAITATSAADRPNILLIVSDDQGYNDLGFLGNGIITPALDRLAREGTRLTDFYVAWPACTPSRAAFLTGRYPQRNGMYDMVRNEAPDYGYLYKPAEYEVSFERIGGMDTREIVVAEVLQSAGYQTVIFGKWDLGSLKRFLPTRRGFDRFYGFVNTGIDYYTHERYGVPSMYRDGNPTTEDRGTYCTDLFEREALGFLEQRDRDRPFFLYLPFNAPHNSSALEPVIRSSVQAPTKYKQMYPEVAEETQVRNNYRYGNPATVTTSAARRRDYRAAVTAMDASIEKVLKHLESEGSLDDTIVIFFSDNGGSGGADNTPLRGRKAQLWEGGVRVPCLVRWPGGDVPGGHTSNAMLSSLELFPSLLVAAGMDARIGVPLDGKNWWSALQGAAGSKDAKDRYAVRESMFWKRRDHLAARVGDWKWRKIGESPPELYNLADDIGETENLATSRPEKLAELESRFTRWQNKMDAAPSRGPFQDY